MYECKSYDELSKIVNDWLNSSDSEDDDGKESTFDSSSKETAATTPESDTKSGYKSLDDAFADLVS